MDFSDNKALVRLSPFQELSPAQQQLKERLLSFCRKHIRDKQTHICLLQGAAGTGKSRLLVSVFRMLQYTSRFGQQDPLFRSDNHLLVNHAEMLKLYKETAGELPEMRKKDIDRPTSFINRMHKTHQKADIVLIDEAHLLLTRSDTYNHFYQDNQLKEIIACSRIVILVFDPCQVLKFKSYWQQENLMHLVAGYPHEIVQLTEQFRIKANPDVVDWIRSFHDRRLLPLPEKQQFDFRIFEDAGELYDTVKKRNAEYGLSRMLSTYDYYYKLDGKDYYIDEPNLHIRWDRSLPAEKQPWAERADTIDEVGSVYTIQGFDLNYAGIILGPSVDYDPQTDRITMDASRYEDSAAFMGSANIPDSGNAKIQIMFNALQVLLTRGVYGLYIYASNASLRERLKKRKG